MTAPVTHGSWVTWVMGQELNGSLGSWVTLTDPFPALVCRILLLFISYVAAYIANKVVYIMSPCAMLLEILANTAQLYEKSHLTKSAGE